MGTIGEIAEADPNAILALVVDDEAPARRRLIELLERDADVGPILTAENGVAAIATIQESRPDIVFLDVQMPGVDGFGVVEAIGPENMPLTVFVTAYDRFAIQAFDVDAVDYLLKPYGDRRYEATMARVRNACGTWRTSNRTEQAPWAPSCSSSSRNARNPARSGNGSPSSARTSPGC
jgi:two-component system LytT family response regulator